MKRDVYRRPVNVVGTVLVSGFGLLFALPTVATYRLGFGMGQLFGTSLVLMMFQLGWLATWRPSLVLSGHGMVLRSAFSSLTIPHGQIKRLVLPPETAGLEIELKDGTQRPVSGFGSSMVSRWLGNRQEHRIAVRFEEVRGHADRSADESITRQINWFAILFPTATVIAFFVPFILGLEQSARGSEGSWIEPLSVCDPGCSFV